MKLSNPEYLVKAAKLSVEEQERLMSRMGGKLPRRLEKERLTREEALAIQMELEDEQLQEWRERMHALKAKHEEKTEKDAKPAKDNGKKKSDVTKNSPAEAPAAKVVKKAAKSSPAKSVADEPAAKAAPTRKTAKKPV
jgi:tRNA(Phe) wybutosine-synthesizing methylase Tyw3